MNFTNLGFTKLSKSLTGLEFDFPQTLSNKNMEKSGFWTRGVYLAKRKGNALGEIADERTSG